jgi:RimJ/RimL family protein N-acetyltransferase
MWIKLMLIDETEHLIIREWEPCEAKEAAELLSLFDSKAGFDEEKVLSYIDVAYGFYGYGYWGVFEKKSGRMIGLAGFREGSCPLEIGYAVREEYRNRGFATEAVKSLTEFALSDFLWVVTEEDNHEKEEELFCEASSDSAQIKLFGLFYEEKLLCYGRTKKDNIASQRVLISNGFKEIR